MGYTHYWNLNSDGSQTSYANALGDIRKIVQATASTLAGPAGTGEARYACDISFNGKSKDGEDYETFCLPEHLNQAHNFNCCKTACKSYDPVVTACLAVLAEVLRGDVKVSSDGGPEDWRKGVALASKILGRTVLNPMAVDGHRDPQKLARGFAG